MSLNSLGRIEKHYEREYEKNYTRRRHTHDLILRVLTAHLSIVLGVLAATGFLLKGNGMHPAQRSVLTALLSAAIGTGILFFLSIINLHIARDFYRQREKLLYRILEYLVTVADEPLVQSQEATLAKLSEDYTTFGRMDMTQDTRLTSLFTLFCGCIYLSNALLGAFLATQIGPGLGLPPIVVLPLAIVLLQYLAGSTYKRRYLAQYARRTDAAEGSRFSDATALKAMPNKSIEATPDGAPHG